MQARDVLLQNIADKRGVQSLCYEDGAEEFHILDSLFGGEIGGNSCILRIDYPTNLRVFFFQHRPALCQYIMHQMQNK